MKKILAAAAIAASFVTPAFSADMAVKAPMYTKTVAPAYNWSGFYLGINGGWIGSASNSFANSGTDAAAAVGIGNAINVGAIPSLISMKKTGGIVGGTMGWNLQFSPNWVAGIETDLDYVSSQKSSVFGPNPVGAVSVTSTYKTELDYLGTVRARLGFTPNNSVLVYGTGGFAYGGAKLNSAFICTACGPASSTEPTTGQGTSKVMYGFSAGGGAEWQFATNWSLKAEYLYVDLGNISNQIVYTYPVANVSTSVVSHRERDNIARIGLNYALTRY